jgi:hypothetical protein
MDSEAHKLLWIATALGAGVAVIITLIAAADAIPRWSIASLVILGSICFGGAVIGLEWAHFPLKLKDLLIFAAIWIGMSLLGWAVWSSLSISAEVIASFHAPAVNGDGRYLYADSAAAGTITPVQLLVDIRITNDTSEGILIDSYSVEAKEGWWKWHHLSRLDGRFGQIYMCLNTFKDCRLLQTNSTLDAKLGLIPIPAHMSISGWVPFRDEWPYHCKRLDDLQIVVRDTKGRKINSHISNPNPESEDTLQGADLEIAPGVFDLSGKRYIPKSSPLPHSY